MIVMDYNLLNPWIHTDNEQVNRRDDKIPLTVEHPLLNIGRMIELENHHFAIFKLIIDLAKNHQWI